MAAPQDTSASKPENGGRSSIMQTALVVLALTIVSGGAGGFLGMSLNFPGAGDGKTEADHAPVAPAAPKGQARDGHRVGDAPHGDGQVNDARGANLKVKELPPIVTNLGAPETSWIRLQAAIVYDPSELRQVDRTIAELMSDITAFLRTVALPSLEGPDGLRRLQEDLSERVAIRSERKVREFILETMVVQ